MSLSVLRFLVELRKLSKGFPVASMTFVLVVSLVLYSVAQASFEAFWLRIAAALFAVAVPFGFLLLLESGCLKPRSKADRLDSKRNQNDQIGTARRAAIIAGFVFLSALVPLVFHGFSAGCGRFLGFESFGSPARGLSAAFSMANVSSEALPESASCVAPYALLGFFGACAFTAFFEELLFRGVVITGIGRRCLPSSSRQALFAALVSACLFGLAHLDFDGLLAVLAECCSAESFSSDTPFLISLAQIFLKPIQAGLFGFCMAFFFLGSASVWVPVVVHFLFDVLYFAPSFLLAGTFPMTYANGSPLDLIQLVLSAIVLLFAAVFAWRGLSAPVAAYDSPCVIGGVYAQSPASALSEAEMMEESEGSR